MFIQLRYLKLFNAYMYDDWSDEQTIYFILLKCFVNVVSCGTQSIHYIKIETKGLMDLWISLFLLVLENAM